MNHPPGTRPTVQSAKRGPLVCRAHTEQVAAWRCEKCGLLQCKDCPTIAVIQRQQVPTCRSCKSVFQLKPITDRELDPDLFRTLVREAPRYPLSHGGPIMLGFSLPVGIGLFIVRDTLFANYIWFGVIAFYFLAYGAHVFTASSRGEAEPPNWPDVVELYRTVFIPTGSFMIATAVTFGPSIIAYTQVPHPWRLLSIPLGLLGAFLWPMAMMSMGHWNNMLSLSPPIIYRSIQQNIQTYTWTTVLTVLILAIILCLGSFLLVAGFLSFLLLVLSMFYLMMVQMRLLGIFYYVHREELGWFNERSCP